MLTVALPRHSNPVLIRRRLSWLHNSEQLPNLVVVWATAGAGKTTLLATWADELRKTGENVAWASVADVRPGGEALESLVAREFERMPASHEHQTIFVDDAHLVSGRRDRQWLSELTAAPVPGLTVVLAGRYQPIAMPRATYGGECVEFRTKDLAFTNEETAVYFRERGIELSDAQVQSVVDRSDGWAVALSLMASRLGHTLDINEFINAFTGNLSSVADYLVTEVLAGQPDARRRFLLDTSIVDELTVPLAVHLSGRTNAGDILDELEDDNTVIRTSDGDQPTFHYHSLLRSHLRAQLRSHDYAGSIELHRSAAQWFLTHGRPDRSLGHALATDDCEYIGRVLLTTGTSLIFSGQVSLVQRAVDLLDEAQMSTASSHLLTALLAAPHFFNQVAADHHIAVARQQIATLSPHLRTVLCALVLMRASDTRAITEAERSLALAEHQQNLSGWTPTLDETALDTKVFADAARGCALMARGDGAAASSALQLAARNSGMTKRPWLSMLLLDLAATSSSTAGRWAEASTIEALMTSASLRHGQTHDPASALAHLTIAVAAYTRCDDIQPTLLSDVIATGEAENDTGLIVPAHVLTQLNLLDGRANPRSGYEELDRWLRSAPRLPRSIAMAAYRYVELTLRFRGKPQAREALHLIASTLGTTSVDYQLVSTLLHRDTAVQDSESLGLQAALESATRVWYPPNLVLGWLFLSRLAEDTGRTTTADEWVQRALTLAEHMRARRPFMVSDGWGARLLETRQGRLGSHEVFAQTVLDSYHRTFSPAAAVDTHTGSLTRKEHDILRELPYHQSIAEIARKQHLSANTVKTHLRSIYEKFGVNGRFEAVEYATRSGLI
jgi:LuxR family maltose regulon positive regulatory protein